MSPGDAKWRHVGNRLRGWAASLVEGLTEGEQHRAWLAGKALLRRPDGRPPDASPLSVEAAFEAAVQRLRAGKAGDEVSALAFERLVRQGYLADREESLPGFTADLDLPARQEVSALACILHRRRGTTPRSAVTEALRIAYDRAHHPDPALREESAGTLRAAVERVEASAVLRLAVASFVADHMRTLDGLPD